MSTDLFRIAVSREVDRSRYLRAILSTQRSSFKRNLPQCLRPEIARPGQSPESTVGIRPDGLTP
jgi:hypothetical protein